MLKRIRARELSHAAGYAVGVGGFEVFLRDLFLLLGGPDGVRAFDVQNARIPNIERPDPMEGLLVGRNVESRKGGNRAAGIWKSGAQDFGRRRSSPWLQRTLKANPRARRQGAGNIPWLPSVPWANRVGFVPFVCLVVPSLARCNVESREGENPTGSGRSIYKTPGFRTLNALTPLRGYARTNGR
jgi:hypothetical protein